MLLFAYQFIEGNEFMFSATELVVLFGFQIGRRIFRQRLETGDREGDLEQRRVGLLCLSF